MATQYSDALNRIERTFEPSDEITDIQRKTLELLHLMHTEFGMPKTITDPSDALLWSKTKCAEMDRLTNQEGGR